jgi:hypothetical protein
VEAFVASLPTDLRSRTILGLSRAIGAEPPAAASPNASPQAAGPSSTVEDFAEHLGNLRPVGRISRAICIAAGEKAVARLKREEIDLAATLAALRIERPDSPLIDRTAFKLAAVRHDLRVFGEQLDELKRGR